MVQYLYGIFIYFMVNISTLVLTLCTENRYYILTLATGFFKYKGDMTYAVNMAQYPKYLLG